METKYKLNQSFYVLFGLYIFHLLRLKSSIQTYSGNGLLCLLYFPENYFPVYIPKVNSNIFGSRSTLFSRTFSCLSSKDQFKLVCSLFNFMEIFLILTGSGLKSISNFRQSFCFRPIPSVFVCFLSSRFVSF